MGGSLAANIDEINLSELDDGEVITEIKKQANGAFSYYSQNYQDYKTQVQFVMLNQQWDLNATQARDDNSKATLTFNLIYPEINAAIGEYCKSRPGLVLRSETEDEHGEQLADLADGLVRQIAYESRLETVLQDCLRNTMTGGFGFLQIKRDYDGLSFDQKLKIYCIQDPTWVYFDPAAEEPSKCDGDFIGCAFSMSKAQFKKTYPDAKSDVSYPISTGTSDSSIQKIDEIILLRHYSKEYFVVKLVKLSDGTTCTKKDAKKIIQQKNQEILEQHGELALQMDLIEIVDERDAVDYKIMERVINNDEVLEATEWPSKYFPIIYVNGDTTILEGREYTKSYAKFVNDQQRLLNYSRSELAVYLLSSEREGYLATPENIKGHEASWRDKGRVKGCILYNPDPIAGAPIPVTRSPFPEAMLALDASLSQGIQQGLGRYGAMDGEGLQGESGKAAEARIRQGNNNQNIYVKNVNIALDHLGVVLIDMLPRIYDTTREVTIRDKDDKPSKVVINQPASGMYLNELDSNSLQVQVEAGSSFSIQRQDDLNMMMRLAEVNPSVNAAIPDLLAKNTDLKDKSEIVKRMQMILPPEIRAQVLDEPMPEQQPPPEMIIEQMKMNQAQMKQEFDMQKQQQDIQMKQEQLDFNRQKMALEYRNSLANHEATQAKTQAEITKAALGVEQAHISHNNKRTEMYHKARETNRRGDIEDLLAQNEKLKKRLSQITGVPYA